MSKITNAAWLATVGVNGLQVIDIFQPSLVTGR